MKLLGALVTLAAVLVAAIVLIPLLAVALAVATPVVGLVVWWLPVVLIAVSANVGTAEKILWILAMVFLSWFAWIFYFFFAPVFAGPRRHSYY